MKLLNFAIIKITLCLITGILLAHYYDIPLRYILISTLVLILSIGVFLIVEKGRLVKSSGFGVLALLTFIGLGMFTYHSHDQKEFKLHYTQYIDPGKDRIETISFRIREVLKPSSSYDKYVVDLSKINQTPVVGKTLLNIKRDSFLPSLKVDDVAVTTAALASLNPSLNPHQFDYRLYLQKQYIYHQVFTDRDHLLTVRSEPFTVFGYAAQLRTHINRKLKSYPFDPDELSLINALLLGQRQDISPEIFNSYSKAGVIHILAVSGLHVGIILLLLNSLFKPLEYFKHGKTLKIVLIVVILWSFAVVAGLSASVTRAVTMFSIVAIGMNLKRPSNRFNTLAISMFFILLLKPLFLFDVGFQMSYLAVLAIMAFQPSLERLWRPRFLPLRKLWQIFTVTLAAQLGVVPISLYYFHQFPGLFFISNLVIIPFLGMILGLGILIIVLAVLNLLPLWLAEVYGGMIHVMNKFVHWVSLQERFILTDVSFSGLQVVTAYLLILSLFPLFRKQNFKSVSMAMAALLIFQLALIFEKHQNQADELIVFHKSTFSLLGIKRGPTFSVSHNFDSLTAARDKSILNYKIGNAIKDLKTESLENMYMFNAKNILIVDRIGIYGIREFQPEYVILRESPKINLNRLLDTFEPELIIADGSNYKTYIQRWEATCKERKIPFHVTSRDGAFMMRGR